MWLFFIIFIQFVQKYERKEKIEQIFREKERQRLETTQRKWTKKEEQEFYKTVSTFGVEFDRYVSRRRKMYLQ
jgi:chromodomain-helicase-DNA-binding protein 7